MDKSLYGHGVLALAATILAYLAWSYPSLLTQDQRILIFAGNQSNLQQLRFEDEQYTVELSKREQVWLAKSTIKAHGTSSSKWYPASSQAKTLIEQSAPLYGLRSLGTLSTSQQQDFSLHEAKTHLTLQHGAEEVQFTIGGLLYGSSDYYMQTSKQQGYLLAGAYISPLMHGGGSLLDKQLLSIDRNQLEQVTFTTPTAKRTFLQAKIRPGETPYLVAAEDSSKKMDNASTWLDRLLRIRIQDYASSKPLESPTVQITLHKQANHEVEQLAYWQQPDGTALIELKRFPDGPVLLSKAVAEPLNQMLADVMRDGHLTPPVEQATPATTPSTPAVPPSKAP